MGVILGIDFGMTNTTVCYPDRDGVIHNVMSREGLMRFPSIVYFDPSLDEVCTGSAAFYEGMCDPEGMIRNFKSFIGRIDSLCVRDREFTVEWMVTAFLTAVLRDVEDYLDGEKIDGAVLSAPAYYTKDKLRILVSAAEGVVLSNGEKLKIIDVVNDPAACALAHCFLTRENRDKNVLIYDLGGTFDVSLVRMSFSDGIAGAKILDTHGDHELSGDEWDRCIREKIICELCDKYGYDPEEILSDPEAMCELYEKAYRTKIKLTRSDSAVAHVWYDGIKERILITRKEFDELTEPLLQHTLDITGDMLEHSGGGSDSIDEILLVGRAARMPQIKDALSAKYGKPVIEVYEESLSAFGAALIGNTLANT